MNDLSERDTRRFQRKENKNKGPRLKLDDAIAQGSFEGWSGATKAYKLLVEEIFSVTCLTSVPLLPPSPNLLARSRCPCPTPVYVILFRCLVGLLVGFAGCFVAWLVCLISVGRCCQAYAL